MNITKAEMAIATAESSAPALEIGTDIVDPAWTRALPEAVAWVERSARAAFLAGPVPGTGRDIEVSVLLTDDDEVADLNAHYRGKQGPTNVLSFPSGDGPLPGDAAMPMMLGDVVIAFGVTRAEAEAAGIPIAHHLSHLVVHGMLHLMGLDHEDDAEAERMEQLETEILARLGVADPYGGER